MCMDLGTIRILIVCLFLNLIDPLSGRAHTILMRLLPIVHVPITLYTLFLFFICLLDRRPYSSYL